MKLSADIDLGPIRALALVEIDAIFARLASEANALRHLHDAKADAAAQALGGATPHPTLVAEARIREVDMADLCGRIVQARDRHRDAMLTLEHDRQIAVAAVASATDEHGILAILNPLGRR